MRILVTGGAGFVGSVCLRHLLAHGHEAVAYDNLAQGHAKSVPQGRLIIGDIADHAGAGQGHARLPRRGGDALRRRDLRGRIRLEPGVPLPQQRGRDALAAERDARGGGQADALLQHLRHLRDEPQGPHGRELAPGPVQPVRPHQARRRMDDPRLRARLRPGLHAPGATSTPPAPTRTGSFGEDHRPENHLIPLVLQVALGQRERIDIFGTGLSDAGRHVHPRLHPHRRLGAGAPAGRSPRRRPRPPRSSTSGRVMGSR